MSPSSRKVTSEGSNALRLIDAELSIARTKLVSNINLEVKAGEIVVLLGPNGAGKSSVLNLLSGQRSPSSGQALMADIDIGDWPLRDKARRMAVLAQTSTLSFAYKVEDVVGLGRIPHDSGRVKNQVVVEQCLELMDVLPLRQRLYTELSGGEQQRVQLARVLAQSYVDDDDAQCSFLLLDEPTSALDLSHQQLILQSCRERASKNCGVVMVLHDLNLAFRYADRLVLLDKGRIVAQGPAEQLADAQLIRSVYGVDAHIVKHPLHGCPSVVF